ncbi:hypothetical protein PENTCL1PPCAC_6884, partial [Pristionchus entomophagus]
SINEAMDGTESYPLISPHFFTMARLFLLLLTSPLLSSAFPGFSGGLFGGGNGDLSYALGLQARPNSQLTADVGTGAAGAIDAATQAFVNGLLGIGGSVIDGASGLGKAGLNGAAGLGGALGGAAAGAASAAGKGAASLGGSLGSSLDFGLSGSGNAQIEAALAKVAAGAATFSPVSSLNCIINSQSPLFQSVRTAIQDAVAAAFSDALNGSASVSLGPLGSIGAGAGVKKAINGTAGGAAAIGF